MKRKQIIVLLLMMLISAIGLLLFIQSTLKNRANQIALPVRSTNEEVAELTESSPVATIAPETSASPKPSSSEESKDIEVYATITIQTDKRTKTFNIYPDVAEETLDAHIGHLPSSANPGEAGLCVLMGHRDRELRILKYAKVGDVFTVKKNGTQYSFSLTRIVIQNNEDGLAFPISNSSGLAIVTCYPFDFFGASPQRIIFYCKKQ